MFCEAFFEGVMVVVFDMMLVGDRKYHEVEVEMQLYIKSVAACDWDKLPDSVCYQRDTAP